MAIEQFKKLVDEYYCAVADYWDPRTAERRDWPRRREAAKALYEYVETLERERDGAMTREENTVAICNSERKAIEARVEQLEATGKEEVWWLIEHRPGCTWWDGRSPETFTPDPNDCVRFARKEDAERVLAAVVAQHNRASCIVTEHMWCDTAPLVEH